MSYNAELVDYVRMMCAPIVLGPNLPVFTKIKNEMTESFCHLHHCYQQGHLWND